MNNNPVLFVGSYAEANEQGLYVYRFDPASEVLQFVSSVSGIVNPSYICISPDTRWLYAISEFTEGENGKMTAYSIQEVSTPRFGGESSYSGFGSCYIAVDSRQRHAFIANYGAGTLAVLSLKSDGTPGSPLQVFDFAGHGPNEERQEQPHIHTAVFSVDEKFLYSTDLGTDRIYVYEYHPDAELPLIPTEPLFIALPPGCGPRHLAFSPDGRWMYVICELSGEIFLFLQDGKSREWIQRSTVIEEGYTGKIEAADIQIDAAGQYLYASSRGDANEIIVFRIDQESGLLSFHQRISCQGESPRNLSIEPAGRFLFVANENSDSITVFKIEDGRLSFTGKSIYVNKPSCLKFLGDPDGWEAIN